MRCSPASFREDPFLWRASNLTRTRQPLPLPRNHSHVFCSMLAAPSSSAALPSSDVAASFCVLARFSRPSSVFCRTSAILQVRLALVSRDNPSWLSSSARLLSHKPLTSSHTTQQDVYTATVCSSPAFASSFLARFISCLICLEIRSWNWLSSLSSICTSWLDKTTSESAATSAWLKVTTAIPKSSTTHTAPQTRKRVLSNLRKALVAGCRGGLEQSSEGSSGRVCDGN
eukprot:754984-Hanusia_phi.AAC.9